MIAVSSSGRSFRAIATYLAAGRSGQERDRVAWATARNLPTNDPELAGTFMRATAAQNVRVEKPVYHVAISFDPGDPVDRATMERVADRLLERLGLAEHEAVIVAHRDREHPHLHLLANRVHPVTGRVWDRWQDQPAIQRVLREEERALEIREVPGRLYQLPEPDRHHVYEPGHDVAIRAARNHAMPDRAVLTRGEWQQRETSGEAAFIERVRTHLPALRATATWTEMEAYLAGHGLRLERSGQGLLVTDGEHQVKASRIARDLSMGRLETRFRMSYDTHLREHLDRAPAAERDGASSAQTVQVPAVSGVGLVPESPLAPGADTPQRLAVLARQLETYEQVAAIFGEHYAATHDLSAARARLAQVEAGEVRARVATESFMRGLATVYRDPGQARDAFDAVADAHGIEHAVRVMREEPERFGALRTVEARRAFGLVRVEDDVPARRAALSVATQGREAWYARAGVPAPPEIAEVRAAVVRASERERMTREAHKHSRNKSLLEREIGRAMWRLLPHEVQELRLLVTAPRFAIAVKLREAMENLALGRDTNER